MKSIDKLRSANFKFNVKSVLSLDGVYTCDDLPDRKIMISRIKDDDPTSVTTKCGERKIFNLGDRYLCTLIFHTTGFSFNYEFTYHSMPGFMQSSNDSVAINIETIIENQLANCYFNFVSEAYCKQVLNSFGINFSNVSGIVFSRHVTDGLPHFTIDYKYGDINYRKSYIYDDEKSIIYEKTNKKAGIKFNQLFESTYLSSSWFFFYKSLNCDSFKLHIMDSNDKKYTKLNYYQEELTVFNYEGEVVSIIEGDNLIHKKINQIIHQKIINTPSSKLKNYVKAFNLDLYQLSMDDILVINMVDY